MSRSTMTYAAGALAAVLLVGGGVAFWIQRPTTLTVAVSRLDTDDTTLVATIASQLKHEHKPIHLRLVPADTVAAATAAVDKGAADLAVVRTDVALPTNAQTVVILHRDAFIITVPAASDLHELKDLVGHRIGIVRDGTANLRLLEAALAQIEVKADAVNVEPLQAGDVADAIRQKRVDAVLSVDVVSSTALHDVVKAVAVAGGGPPSFIAIEEATAIAQRSPAYEATKVVKGAFGGSPARPDDEFDTISVTHRLMANEATDQTAVATLTKFLLAERSTLAGTMPLARQIEAPSTDKGSPLPVHVGAAAYIDDEEQTFFDKYSDMIYIGAMMLGVLASGATALLTRLNAQKSAALDDSVERLVEMLKTTRSASSPAMLDALESEADALLASAVRMLGVASDDGRRAAFALVLDQVHAAIRDRRPRLSTATTPVPDPGVTFAQASAAE